MLTRPTRAHEALRSVWPLALASAAKPGSGDWVYETKYDGFRAVAAVVDGEVELQSKSRRRHDRG